MRLRTIRGRSVPDALRRVQQELGPNALVLETHDGDGGAEVVAADVEREEPAESLMRLRAELALLRREMRQGALAPAQPGSSVLPAVLPRLAKVAERLLDQDVRPELLERVLKMLRAAPEQDGDPIDPAASDFCRAAVAGLVPGAGPAAARRARCHAFVGPPGAGKSTTIAKLAEQSRRAGDSSFGVITLDADRPGACEVLANCAERLALSYRVVRGPEDLMHALDSLGKLTTLLVDTAGLGVRENASLAALRERLNLPQQLAAYLVLPANMESRALRACAHAFLPFAPAGLVFTKVDEAERLGCLVNLPAEMSLPVAALGHGRTLSGDLARSSRNLIADLVLGRRSRSMEAAAR